MSERYQGQEPPIEEPKKAYFGLDINDENAAAIGRLYDVPGQVFEPEADISSSGGLRSMDSRHANTSFVAGQPRRVAGSETNGCLIIKTEAETYWVERGVLISVEETVRSGKLVAELATDSDPRIVIDNPWRYKPAGATGLAGWKGLSRVLELAVDAFEYEDAEAVGEGLDEGKIVAYYGFTDAFRKLESVNIDPEMAAEMVLQRSQG
ncbi:MAG TPA: hypothetical protein VII55_03045 [Candidatus Saccharimonadales bacterium]